MFSIYGVTGQIFSGTLEEMNRVHALKETRSARVIAQDGEELGVEAEAGGRHKDAIQAYRSVLPRELERGPLYYANHIMQRQVIAVSDSDDVAQAWLVLRDHRIHQAPVLDAESELIGIVSERDLLTTINIDGGEIIESLHRRVRDVMTTPVVAAAPVTDIRRIAKVMLDYGVDGIPIIGGNRHLVGFLSRSDILRAVITDPPLSLWR